MDTQTPRANGQDDNRNEAMFMSHLGSVRGRRRKSRGLNLYPSLSAIFLSGKVLYVITPLKYFSYILGTLLSRFFMKEFLRINSGFDNLTSYLLSSVRLTVLFNLPFLIPPIR